VRREFHERDATLPYLGLVDSGADQSVLPADVAMALGIAFGQIPGRVSGPTGGAQAVRAAEDVAFQSPVGPVLLRLPHVRAEVPDIVLGRPDFFMQYEVTFDEPQQRFWLARRPGA